MALEVLSSSPLPWGAYYARRGETHIPLASFGVQASLPELQGKIVHEALLSGSMRFLDGRARIYPVFDGHFFLVSDTHPLPVRAIEELRETGNRSPLAKGKFRLYPSERYTGTSSSELVRLGLSRNFLFVSFFILNASNVVGRVAAKCPHSDVISLRDELRGYAMTVLGSSGHALSLKNEACFCVFYSHAPGDAELIATQVAKTLSRSLDLGDAECMVAGPFSSKKLSDDDMESSLRSFADGA